MFNKEEARLFKQLINEIKVKDIMMSPVVKIKDDEDLSLAQIKFINYHHITHLPVVDKNDRVVGLISRKYLYKTHSPRRAISDEEGYVPGMIRDGDSYYIKETLDSYILRHVMMPNPYLMSEEDSVAEVVLHMVQSNIGCGCVLDKENKLSGILTDHEIVQFIGTVLTRNYDS